AAQGAVLALDRETGRTRRLFAADSRVGRLDLSADGKRLLVSWARLEGSIELPILLTWDLEKGAFSGSELRGLREGAWAGDSGAIVALETRGSGTDLVAIAGEKREILLEGGPERVYGQPVSRDGRIVYLLAKDSGATQLLRFDAMTREARALAPALPLDHMRHLALARASAVPDGSMETSVGSTAAAEGSTAASAPVLLSVTFAAENPRGAGLYRAALIEDGVEGEAKGGVEGEALRLRRQELSLSGSVLWPALSPDAELFYIAQFSQGMFVCRFPGDGSTVPMKEAGASWTLLDPSYLRARDEPPLGAPKGASTAQAPAAEKKAGALPLLVKTFRQPFVSDDRGSAGLVIGGRDLSERLAWNVGAAYAWGPQALDLSFAAKLEAAPWAVRTTLVDDFAQTARGGYYRMTGAALAVEREWRFLPLRRAFALVLDLAAGGTATVEQGAAYSSPYAEARYGLRTIARFGDERVEPFPPRHSRGYSAFLAADLEGAFAGGGIASLGAPATGIQAGLDAAFPLAGAELILRASASPSGGLNFGPRGRTMDTGSTGSILGSMSPYYSEFEDLASAYAPLYGFGQVSILALSAELQERPRIGALGLPLFFQRFQARLGCRAAALAEPRAVDYTRFLASTFLRAEFSASPLIGGSSQERYTLGLEVAYALTPLYSGQRAKFSLIFDSDY
ncbi:MAG: hypothetical protein Q8M76_13485, partial [Spirochaetaceae bacterium]|nr:hypothetical protein [Spirochaetaceae bacterium]